MVIQQPQNKNNKAAKINQFTAAFDKFSIILPRLAL